MGNLAKSKDGNSTQPTAETFSGAMCGGVINQTEFFKDPMAYMMAYYMPDKQFELYVKAKNDGEDKIATKLFDKYARSAI